MYGPTGVNALWYKGLRLICAVRTARKKVFASHNVLCDRSSRPHERRSAVPAPSYCALYGFVRLAPFSSVLILLFSNVFLSI